MNTYQLMDVAFSALERRKDPPPSADTARESQQAQRQKDVPHAGLGSVEAGTPIVRYWTVKYRYGASIRWNYDHVIACDPWKATLVVMKRDQSIDEAYVVREIQRDEYEHLTRKSP